MAFPMLDGRSPLNAMEDANTFLTDMNRDDVASFVEKITFRSICPVRIGQYFE